MSTLGWYFACKKPLDFGFGNLPGTVIKLFALDHPGDNKFGDPAFTDAHLLGSLGYGQKWEVFFAHAASIPMAVVFVKRRKKARVGFIP